MNTSEHEGAAVWGEHEVAGLLREAREELAECIPDRAPQVVIDSMRAHYELTLRLAHAKRAELRKALFDGLPRLVGNNDAMACLAHGHMARLINSFADANRALWNAAQSVCEYEDLADDGSAEGIEWEVPL